MAPLARSLHYYYIIRHKTAISILEGASNRRATRHSLNCNSKTEKNEELSLKSSQVKYDVRTKETEERVEISNKRVESSRVEFTF